MSPWTVSETHTCTLEQNPVVRVSDVANERMPAFLNVLGCNVREPVGRSTCFNYDAELTLTRSVSIYDGYFGYMAVMAVVMIISPYKSN